MRTDNTSASDSIQPGSYANPFNQQTEAPAKKPSALGGAFKRLSARLSNKENINPNIGKLSSNLTVQSPAAKAAIDNVPRMAINHMNPPDLPDGMKALAARDQRAQGELQPEARGEVLTDSFVFEGQEIMCEKATRADVVSMLSKGNADRIEHLKGAIRSAGSQSPVDEAQLGKLMLKLENCVKLQGRITASANQNKTWASSASYRKLLEHAGSVKAANEQYIPACVNLRTQVVTTPGGDVSSSINRSGAVSDYRNGATNLEEMKDLKVLLDVSKGWNQLTAQQREILHNALPESRETGFEDTHSPKDAGSILENAIADRELVLENQALQDLAAHFDALQSNGTDLQAHINSTDRVVFGRVSMLDGIKEPVVGEFVLNERNQMLDMKAIYQVLNGKELVFDGKGPFIDTSGKVHMPFNIQHEGKAVSKPLNTVFFNISAQGNIQNEGAQKEINKEALKQLKELVADTARQLMAGGDTDKHLDLVERFVGLQSSLENGVTDGFDTAQAAMDLLLDCQSLVSINCFSGKDRTGLLAAQRTLEALKTAVDALNISDNQKRVLIAKFGRQLLSDGGIACKVVADNTGHLALKLSVAKLQLLMNNDDAVDLLLGCGQRVEMYGKAAATFLDAVKGAPSLEERGSGQLHVD